MSGGTGVDRTGPGARMAGDAVIEREVIGHALTAIAEEMALTIWRTAHSGIVRELLDFSTAVFDAEGRLLAQSARIPQHLNSMGAALSALLSGPFPAESFAPGDVIVFNDPYAGGQHIPDLLAFRAAFHEGERLGFAGVCCHHLDMGGMAAGSYAARATEIFQEGLRLPPVKLIEAGRRNETLLAVITHNLRTPEAFLGDLAAEIAALEIGVAGLARLARRYGVARLARVGNALLDLSENLLRHAIAALPDGRYTFTDHIDDDGLGERPYRIEAAVEVRGDHLTVDLTGSDDQARGPINATRASTLSAVTYAVMAALGSGIPVNAGCERPITVITRPGSIVDAVFPAPVANRIVTTHRLATTLLGALHPLLPERIPAAYYGVSYVVSFKTRHTSGRPRVLVEIEVGGGGARDGRDGPSAFSLGMHNNANIPIEMVEAEMPLRLRRYALRPNSGGRGQYRGGLGLIREWEVLAAEAEFSANLERFRFRPYGLAGGEPGAAGALFLIRDGRCEPLPAKIDNVPLRRGDVIRLETSGGGGFGPAAARDPAALRRDLEEGYVTETYGTDGEGSS
jgi:N-methylhydantoinase B